MKLKLEYMKARVGEKNMYLLMVHEIVAQWGFLGTNKWGTLYTTLFLYSFDN